RGADGRPQPLFDRTSGTIDANVAREWETRYDIVRTLRARWPDIGPSLRGKYHVWVGTWDTFHLDGPVHRLQALLATLPGSDAQITFVPKRDHFDLYRGPHGGLTVQIDRAMTTTAAKAPSAEKSG
ncbi:MAG: enterochelin esterase, partial [Candidatus Eremiobacteraeota bacterium]|nr:enterochelin esterase [Candidatus Eremiobacteraeota bacterium]